MIELSLMVGLLNEAENLPRLHRAVTAAMERLPQVEWELLLVDDGSTDGSWEAVKSLAASDSRVRGVRLARNYGNHAALLAALRAARGKYAMNLAADLQTPVDLIPRFLEACREGADLVFGARRRRADGAVDRFFARSFYAAMNCLTPQRMPPGGIDVFMARRPAIEAVNRQSGRNVSILSLLMNLGFRQRVLEYDRPPRSFGRSKWTLAKKVQLFANGIFAYSARPLRLCLPLGLFVGLAGLASLIWALTDGGSTTGLVLSAGAILLGAQLLSTALLGEYLYRTFEEAAARPVWLVAEEIDAFAHSSNEASRTSR
ncbi:MAG: glycosyltransferase family 2 protein [Verrucomicrobiae bacterium]|nr:glycosyltransferase family 2 protein [Verrucomicrobiae bacterium]